MLIATEPKYLYPNITFLQKNSVIININANVTGFYSLCLTPDLKTLGACNPCSQEFDNWYLSQLFENDSLLMNFMQIMCNFRNGKDVILLMYRGSELFDAINEALLKIIQIRYDYNYQIVDSVDGFEYYQDNSTFTARGIIQFDQDYQRYQYLLIKYGLLNTNEAIDETHI